MHIVERQKVIHTLDLKFMGLPNAIASYLVPHAHGAVLVESGPGSTQEALIAGLAEHNLSVEDITDVLLTHIHLDHAGASGWLARRGARIHVHEVGAPHMLSPEKLLDSAQRIYGDHMDELWGEFLPVPEERLSVLHDGDVVEIEDLRFRAIDTPGHAFHHMAYIFEEVCFSGDIGGVRLPGPPHVRLPMPPPELYLESWRASIQKLQREFAQENFRYIAPTHFGIYADAEWHLQAVEQALIEVDEWVRAVMPADPSLESLTRQFLEWTRQRSLAQGLESEMLDTYEAANPSWMSPLGIQRYWRKYHTNG